MSSREATTLVRGARLRVWPAVAAAILLVVLRWVLPAITPELFGIETALIALFGSVVCFLLVLIWWLFFSRAPWVERLVAPVAMVVVAAAMWPFMHVSVQGGFMGRMYFIYALPVSLTLAFVAWAVVSRRIAPGGRRLTSLVAALVIGCGVWTLARTDGVLGARSLLHWRWTPTAEERLIASERQIPPATPDATAPAAATAANVPAEGSDDRAALRPDAVREPRAADATATADSASGVKARGVESVAAAPSVEAATAADPTEDRTAWPGFRGPRRDGVVRGVRINTDWTTSPPVQMWRKAIGPGWSSFAVAGDLFYTQEQRGDDELVSCYRLSTGEPVWQHRDQTRFWESNGGAGPRATPTLHEGRVYAMGATGLLNALDASTGAVIWSRNVAADTGKAVPDWGFASSPVVVDDLVITAVAGQLAAYDVNTGGPRWIGESGGGGYSSPHLVVIDNVPQVVLTRGARTIAVNPADGTLLWEHTTGQPATSIVQPALAGDGDLLLTSTGAMGGNGMRRVSLAHDSGRWTVEEKWESRGLKPYFNDFVVHNGHAFGFDGNILAAIDLTDGTRRWKGGRYGNGQMVLLADQDLLLVMGEEGALALVSATPDRFQEIARVDVFEGKTWNHPVLIGGVLLVRNGEEMAAFRMPLASTR